MPENDDDVWESLSDAQRIRMLRADHKALREEIEGYKKWLRHAVLGALGILLFQALPYLQVIAKGLQK